MRASHLTEQSCRIGVGRALARTMDSPQNHSILLKIALVRSRLAVCATEVVLAELAERDRPGGVLVECGKPAIPPKDQKIAEGSRYQHNR
jgi:hypothetical protein